MRAKVVRAQRSTIDPVYWWPLYFVKIRVISKIIGNFSHCTAVKWNECSKRTIQAISIDRG